MWLEMCFVPVPIWVSSAKHEDKLKQMVTITPHLCWSVIKYLLVGSEANWRWITGYLEFSWRHWQALWCSQWWCKPYSFVSMVLKAFWIQKTNCSCTVPSWKVHCNRGEQKRCAQARITSKHLNMSLPRDLLKDFWGLSQSLCAQMIRLVVLSIIIAIWVIVLFMFVE